MQLSLLVIFAFPPTTFASYSLIPSRNCTAYGDRWYKAEITFDKNTLPTGVTYEPVNKYQKWVQVFGKLSNSSQTPLYIIGRSSGFTEPFEEIDLPKDLSPRYKLVSNKVYLYIPTRTSDGRDIEKSSDMLRPYLEVNNSAVNPFGYQISEKSGDDRPDDSKLPPQDFSFLAFYGNESVTIKGTVLYNLNEKYNSHAQVYREIWCSIYQATYPFNIFLLPILILLEISLLIVVLAKVLLRKPIKKLLKILGIISTLIAIYFLIYYVLFIR